MTVIKICGLRTVEHAVAAAVAGADLIGLVFAPSLRQVTPEQAVDIIVQLRQHHAGQYVGVVGLFVNESPTHINAIAERCRLDYVQLSGDEWPTQGIGICRPVMKTIRFSNTSPEQAWVAHTPVAGVRLSHCPFILDANVAGAYGGTGHLADWDSARDFASRQRVLLAGGLAPDNVVAAMTHVHPWGVDVSSGVEHEGTKDTRLIEAFVRAVRESTPSVPLIRAPLVVVSPGATPS